MITFVQSGLIQIGTNVHQGLTKQTGLVVTSMTTYLQSIIHSKIEWMYMGPTHLMVGLAFNWDSDAALNRLISLSRLFVIKYNLSLQIKPLYGQVMISNYILGSWHLLSRRLTASIVSMTIWYGIYQKN